MGTTECAEAQQAHKAGVPEECMLVRVLVCLWACCGLHAVVGFDPSSGRVAELDVAEEQGLIASDTMTMDGVRQAAAARLQRRQRAALMREDQPAKRAESLQYASIKLAAKEETQMAKLRKRLQQREAVAASERLTKKEQAREAQLIRPVVKQDLGAAVYSKSKEGSGLKKIKAQMNVLERRSVRKDASMRRSAQEFKTWKNKEDTERLKPLLPSNSPHLAKLAEQSKMAGLKADWTGNEDQVLKKKINQVKSKLHDDRVHERQSSDREIHAKQKVSVLRSQLLLRAARKREAADARQDKHYSELRSKAARKRDAARDEGKQLDAVARRQAKVKDLPTLQQARSSLRPGLEPCSVIDQLNGDALCSQPGAT